MVVVECLKNFIKFIFLTSVINIVHISIYQYISIYIYISLNVTDKGPTKVHPSICLQNLLLEVKFTSVASVFYSEFIFT